MLRRQSRQIGAEYQSAQFLPASFRSHGAALQPLRGDCRKTAALQFYRSVHAAHGLNAQSALHFLQRRPCRRMTLRQILAINQQCLISRKHPTIVAQHTESMPVDLRVGGVDIDDVDLAPRQRLIRQSMLKAANRHGLQSISRTQRRPAIPSIEKFG